MILLNDLVQSARQIADRDATAVRFFPGGLFISESIIRNELVVEISKNETYSHETLEALRLQIFQCTDWKWVYWVEPGECLAGIAKVTEEGATFPEEIREATDFIHDRDPYFVEKKAAVRILLHVNWAAEIKVHDNWLKLSHSVLEEFSRLYDSLTAARPFRRAHESELGSVKRDKLRVMVKLLAKSEPVTVTHPEFVSNMRRRGISHYRKYREVIFCISKEGLEGIILDHELSLSIVPHNKVSLDIERVFKAIQSMLHGRQVQKTVRLHKRGVFLAQKAIKKFANAYGKNDVTTTIGRIKRKLKRLTGGEIVYLIDGDRSLFGMLLPFTEIVEAFGWRHKDDIVMGTSMILPDDPLYSSGQGIGLPMRPKCIARFQVGDDLYHISFHAFTRFLERAAPKASDFKTTGAYDVVNQRGFLMLMHELIRKSEPVRRLNGALQLLRHEFRDASYRESDGWIWVILPDKTVITCYHRRNPFKSVFRRKRANPSSSVNELD